MNTAVAIFIYKRPHTSIKLFEVLKQVQPKKIFLFADGPQNDSEAELCKKTQDIFNAIDWTDDVYRDFSPVNIGLGGRLVSGLNYTFSEVEEAIILEDDCIPDVSFFPFCESLLEYYKDNKKIMHISGTNLITENALCREMPYSYFFSEIPFCWGWASWARAWKKFNPDFDTWIKHKETISETIGNSDLEIWQIATMAFENGFRDSWDIQWCVDVMNNNGLSVLPKQNLVSNIGTGEGASYMPDIGIVNNLKTTSSDNPIIHPSDESLNILNNTHKQKMAELMYEFLNNAIKNEAK